MFGLSWARLDQSEPEPAAGAFVGEKEPDRACADNENVSIGFYSRPVCCGHNTMMAPAIYLSQANRSTKAGQHPETTGKGGDPFRKSFLDSLGRRIHRLAQSPICSLDQFETHDPGLVWKGVPAPTNGTVNIESKAFNRSSANTLFAYLIGMG